MAVDANGKVGKVNAAAAGKIFQSRKAWFGL
jgi:hypothetical protein